MLVIQIADRVHILVILDSSLRQAELIRRGRSQIYRHSVIQFFCRNFTLSKLRLNTASKLHPTKICHGLSLRERSGAVSRHRTLICSARGAYCIISVHHLTRLYFAFEAFFLHLDEIIPATGSLVISIRFKKLWYHFLLIWEPLNLPIVIVDQWWNCHGLPCGR